MVFREAIIEDIPQMQRVRNSVTENRLSNPALVTDEACKDYLTDRGKGWVCEVNGSIIGFAIADLFANNIWALFVQPGYERKGIGKKLHELMLDWYFAQTRDTIWLSTAPGTRAETFYDKAGWTKTGIHGKGEVRFEMKYSEWEQMKR